MRILVVDDDAVFREELSELLRDDGHEVEAAPSVAKALEELEREDFELLFTDLKMPRQSGLVLLKEVRARWPQTLVVMITGFATVETAVDAMKLGSFDYIRKPFNIAHLQKVLELAQQELRFRSGPEKVPSIDALVRKWAGAEGREVLLHRSRKLAPRPHGRVEAADLANPSEIDARIEAFLVTAAKPAVLLEAADRMFSGHRRDDILAFFARLRERLGGRGPLVVTFDPEHLSASDATDLRAQVMGPTTRATLESLSNPIRRSVLRRTSQGPCSFTEAMHAAALDDSPKLSFHLHRLVEDGLLSHTNETYRITPKGSDSIRLLAELDAIAMGSSSGNAVLTQSAR